MWIEEVQLKNYRQHREQKFTFSPHMNMIVGPIGSGKSNLIEAIYWGITNQSRNSSKSEDICQFASSKEPSWVKLKLVHDKRLTITRSLRPVSKSLTIEGGLTYTKDNEIKDQMEKILGASYRVMDDYIFVGQDELRGFITQSGAARAKSLRILFGTEKSEKCYSGITKMLEEIRVPLITESDDLLRESEKNLTEKLNKKKEELRRLEATLEATPVDEYVQLIQNYEARTKLESDIKRITASKETLASELVLLIGDIAKIKEEKAALDVQLKESNDILKSLMLEKTAWETYSSAKSYRDRQEAGLEAATKELLSKQAPTKPEEYVTQADNSEFFITHSELQAEKRRIEKVLSSFGDGTTVHECPTCYTPVVLMADKLAKMKDDLPVIVAELTRMGDVIKASSAYDYQLHHYEQHCFMWKQRQEILESQIADLPVLTKPTGDYKVITDTVNSYKSMVESAETYRQNLQETLDSSMAARAGKEGAMGLYVADLAKLATELEQNTVTVKEAKQAKACLDIYESQLNSKLVVASEVGFIESSLNETKERAKKAIEVRQSASRLDDFRGKLVSARDIFHRENLPRRVAQGYLETLNTEINSTLEMLDSSFRVEPVDGVDFKAIFHDGRTVAVDRLSGGEKTIFAIAFRLVINSTFAREVGLLCLDEPTAGLPQNDVQSLEVAFDRLRELSKQRNLQVIMITHERGLGRLFDRVIELSPVQTT